MGFRVCYVASRLPARELAALLNVALGERVEELPDGDWWLARLKNSGWSILWSEDESFVSRAERLLAKSSIKTDLICCEVNETCMWSSAVFWADGRQRWAVSHAGDGDDIYNLNAEGDLPEPFAEIKKRCFLAQKNDPDVDHVFEIPVELVEVFSGFRYDTYLEPNSVEAFHVVTGIAKEGYFSRFFRR